MCVFYMQEMDLHYWWEHDDENFKNCAAFRTTIPFCHFLRLSCSDDPGFFDESEAMVQFSEKKWLSCFSQSSGPPPRPTN